MKTSLVKLFFGMFLVVFSASSFAHFEEAKAGFLSGSLHPILGLDHLFAMLGVGIVSVQLGGNNVYRVPAAFVLVMVIGAVAGIYGVTVPFVEEGISLSVLLLGLAVVFVNSGKFFVVIMLFVSYFGFLHGFAHGAEMPNSINPVYYGGGFLTSTVCIHLLGVGIAHLFKLKANVYKHLRLVGVAMTGVGVVFLIRTLS